MSIVGNAITLGGGSPADLITKSITVNGTYSASDDSADGYSEVTVAVESGADLGTKSVTANGTYNASDDSLDGYSRVTVAVPEDVLTTKTITANDTYNASDDSADGYSSVTVNVPNSYSASDEGKVVNNSALVSQTSTTKTANGTYDTTLNNEVVVDVDANVGTKTITANGTYTASTESLDGYSEVTVNVSGGGSTLVSKSITANGNYNPADDSADGYSAVSVNVPNSYSSSDEGKVVSSGALVAQTSANITANGTVDTTTNDEVVVNVPNSYTASDEGKVVSSGALVAQTSTTVTANGTYDTTENDEVVVNVSGGGSTLVSKTITQNGVYDPADDSADGYSSVTVNVSGGGGATILSGTGAPTASQGSDGNIYLQYGAALDDFAVYKESSMDITVNFNSIVFDYLGNAMIGAQAYKQLDLTDIDSISYTFTSGHHSYDNYATEKFRPLVILENTIDPASNFVANSLYADAVTAISTDDTTVSDTIDTSALSGNYWLVFCSYGCDSTVTDYVVDGVTTITSSYVKVSGAWTALIGAYIDDVTT